MWLPQLGEPEWALVSLAQFRDNILVVATGIGAAWAMANVCRLLANAWFLRVLCSCISETNLECKQLCMRRNIYVATYMP